MTAGEERELWELVCAAFDAKGTPVLSDRIAAIEKRCQPVYEFWLVRNRDRAKQEGWYGGR
jgi:hypothetical protein